MSEFQYPRVGEQVEITVSGRVVSFAVRTIKLDSDMIVWWGDTSSPPSVKVTAPLAPQEGDVGLYRLMFGGDVPVIASNGFWVGGPNVHYATLDSDRVKLLVRADGTPAWRPDDTPDKEPEKPPYVPQVGDVVTFYRNGHLRTALYKKFSADCGWVDSDNVILPSATVVSAPLFRLLVRDNRIVKEDDNA
jgi:hypothetical protein